MFSFGIFSTHIPYIAFVVFYAWFLLFGVEKASRGDFSGNDNSFLVEIRAEQGLVFNQLTADSYCTGANFSLSKNFEAFIFKRKIKPPLPWDVLITQPASHSHFSNRPPPLFV